MQKLGPDRFRILETELALDGGDERWRSYFEAFASDYAAAPPAGPIRAHWPIHITVGAPAPPDREAHAPLAFHRSANYHHWNLTGHGRPGRLALPPYGIELGFDVERGLTVWSCDPPGARAAELVFHAARGLALAVGSSGSSVMLHASAVVIGGRALLFAGTKGAGKSTLFIEALTAAGAHPLANDRVTLRLDHGAVAESWPSYASYCEGTIADYPALCAAFLAYERSPMSAGLTRWGSRFEPDYTQARKRIVPPCFLVESLGRRYRLAAPLGALVLACADLGCTALDVARERTTAQLADHELAAIVFGDDDLDFPCWHGLAARRTGAPDRWQLLRAAALPIIDVQFNPATGKPALRRLFEQF